MPTAVEERSATGQPGMEQAGVGKQLSQGYLLIDTKKCSGCMSCMIACSMVHNGIINLSKARIQIKKNVFGKYPVDDIEQYVCRQCVDAPCVDACPVGALHIEEATGVRVIDEDACIGCKMCIKACSFDPPRIMYDFEYRKAVKCDLCLGTPYWEKEGGITDNHACVDVCSLKAIVFTRDVPEQSDAGYNVNLRKSLHYARANLPISDDGLQPPKEAIAEAGLIPTGSGVTRSFWDDPEIEEGE
ncbi:4Fe-4S dicluster domain-containing protein [Curtanaerobium respiraculi]|uniref:4Fe-4S dicluster domain-containing protein n=1 Tax=Curtanaerobium respiraculi TaxID=2949669 RepID=UPI0024B3AC67|nr:4Fe-4S dicluster domain-containing protein [Curtanaerobium respiraculi]